MKKFQAKIADIYNRKFINGELVIENGKIKSITENNLESNYYILPGLIDSHIHIESTMLIPSEFAKIAIKNGTVGVVCDPHEIANVMGTKGIKFMIKNSKQTPLKFNYCVPSCIPTTKLEKSGAEINAEEIDYIFEKYKLNTLGEMMNFPGVINEDSEVINKLKVAKKHNAQIDGHIPHLSNESLKKYINAGISTDHECTTIEEAIDKINLGMKILIREGSAAQNFDTLYPLISKYNNIVMLCTDDSHPDDLIKYGHINKILKKGISYNIDIFDLLIAACKNPIEHYKLDIGLLKEKDNADFIIVDDIKNFNILETYIDGKLYYSNERIFFDTKKPKEINKFKCSKISEKDLEIIDHKKEIKVIEVIDKELLTNSFKTHQKTNNNLLISDTDKDILKIVALDRYKKNAKPQIGFINGFKLKYGAIASSVSHDNHNIIAIGTNDTDLCNAINEIIEIKGGLTYVKDKDYYTLELEFAGLMTQKSAAETSEIYQKLNKIVKTNGSQLNAPFMTLSFMSLLVIPKLKISTKGLFDVDNFCFTDLFC